MSGPEEVFSYGSRVQEYSPAAFPETFWDDWETKMHREVSHYQSVLYPKIIETIQKIIKA